MAPVGDSGGHRHFRRRVLASVQRGSGRAEVGPQDRADLIGQGDGHDPTLL
jgi:hypothetical protein